jgi:hypothetical protein
MRRRFVMARRPIRDGQLDQVSRLEDLTTADLVERRPTVIAELELGEAGASLFFEGKEIRFPRVAREVLAWVHEQREPFTLEELPGSLDEPGRLVLGRRLIREGYLLALLEL